MKSLRGLASRPECKNDDEEGQYVGREGD